MEARHLHGRHHASRHAVAGFLLAGGALATTAGMLAVAHGVFNSPPQHQHLVGGPVAALVAASPSAGARHTTTPTPTPSMSRPPAPTPTHGTSAATRPAAPPPVTSAPPQTGGGTLLTSADGSVVANCQAGGAYLISWSPAAGFEAGDVIRGPAAVASVQFEQTTTEETMTVSCSSGTPIAHVTGGT